MGGSIIPMTWIGHFHRRRADRSELLVHPSPAIMPFKLPALAAPSPSPDWRGNPRNRGDRSSTAAPARIRRSRRDDRSCHRFAVGVMNEPNWGIKLTCRAGGLFPGPTFPSHRSTPASLVFFDRYTGTQQSRSGSAPQRVHARVAMSCSD
jgi:hypothetical protein